MSISYGYDRTRPRTRIELDATSLSSANTASEKPLILIGSAMGGKPQEPIELTNFAQAKEIFRGGELLDAIELAWRPSPNQSGAGKIFAVRANDATNAQVVKDGLTIKSKLYGADANDIQITMDTDSNTKAKRFTVVFSKEDYSRTYNNVGNIFNIQYIGEEAQASIDIEVDSGSGKATKLVLKTGETGSDVDAEFVLGTGKYENVNTLIHDINNLEGFTAEMDSMGGNKSIRTELLDKVEGADIKTEPYKVKAVGGDLERQLRNDRYVTAEVDKIKTFPEDFSGVSLEGGETNPAPESWSEMFLKVADLGGYYIVPLSDRDAIHGEFSQFLRDESTNGNHLRGFIGGGFDETVEELRSRQMNVRNARVSVVGNSGHRKMSDGRVLNISGYMFATILAGIASGLEIGEPITYKHIQIQDLDTKFTGDQLDQLDASGIVMAEFVRTRGGSFYRVVSDPTTYNSMTEPVQNKISLGEISDFLTTELRTILDDEFIGTRVHSTSASILKNRVESFLDIQKNVGGLIVDYRPDDVQVVISGNTARINLAVQPSQGLDYINVHIKYEDNELEG